MAFKVIGSTTNEYFKPVIKKFPVVSTAMRYGALVTKTGGTTGLALQTAGTAVTVWGVTNHSVASSATGEALIELTPGGTILEADVSEIFNTTTLTATGGSTTTFVDSSIVTGVNSVLIGAKFQVIACAANAALNGTTQTLTGYTSSSGTLTIASVTGGFASGDTMKFLSLNNTYVAGYNGPYPDGTYADTIVLDQTATANGIFRVLGTNADGTKMWLVLLNGVDSVDTVSAT